MTLGPLYPVNLVVAGQRCLVVGGGHVAAQKVRELLVCGAFVTVVAPAVDPMVGALAHDAALPGRLTVEERRYEATDLGGCRLAITATDDPAVNAAVFSDGEAMGVWVNSADDPDHCTFTLPARVRQGPLLATFSTSGRSPAVSTWLRRRFTDELGPEYVQLIDLVAAERESLRAAGRSTEGLDWQSALDSGMLDLIRRGRITEAKELLRSCLAS